MTVAYTVQSPASGKYITLTKQPADVVAVLIDCTPFATDSRGNAITISSVTSAIINAGTGGTPPANISGGVTIVAGVGGSSKAVQFTLAGGTTTWNGGADPPTPGVGTGNILLAWSNGENKQLDLLITVVDV